MEKMSMKAIRIHTSDNVAVALAPITNGEIVQIGEISVKASENITIGHKFALKTIKKGEEIVKYGYPIGKAKEEIAAGSWVHTHNTATGLSEEAEYRYEHKVFPMPEAEERHFMGFLRKDGRAAIRNEIWIIPTVGCVNGAAKLLEKEGNAMLKGSLSGVYAYTHPFGCSQMGDDHAQTRKLLAALAKHPNAGGVLILGLGCENLTMEQFKAELGSWDEERMKFLVCQEAEDEIEEGKKLLSELISAAAGDVREEIPASALVIGMKCGGSDGLSGITANPAVGRFSDRLIAMGGSTILTEVPEMFGAEKILFDRCESEEVFHEAVRMVEEFKKYFTDHGQVVYENPSPGNKAGGITTLEDKSCGCVQKGGSAQVVDVLGYGDRVTKKGLNLLSGPGNDLVSATVLAAAGAHMVLFTTGRGTPFGSPAPTLKIATNATLAEKKKNWIDFDASPIAFGEDPDETGKRLLDLVLEIANGKQTKTEEKNYREISIWKDGVFL